MTIFPHKRFSQAEKEAIVAEGFQATGWLDLSNLTEIQGKLNKEKNLGSQVELNTRIKQIKGRIEEIKTEF